MVIMASGIARGRVHTTTKSRNMAAILQLIVRPRYAALAWFTAFIIDIGHACYGQLAPVKAKYLLTSIM